MRLIIHDHSMAPSPNPVAPVRPAPVAAPLLSKAERALRALNRWRKAGYAIAPPDVRRARGAVCDACEFWRPDGNLGLGECTAPGCGCTRAKIWLAPEKCPLGKWPAQENQ